METKTRREIQYEVRGNLTDAITLSGSNISHMKSLLNKKHVSKKEMRKALDAQLDYLLCIELSKNEILKRTV